MWSIQTHLNSILLRMQVISPMEVASLNLSLKGIYCIFVSQIIHFIGPKKPERTGASLETPTHFQICIKRANS